MRLLKARPKIALVLPKVSCPGDEVLVEVVLQLKRPMFVKTLMCTLTGVENAWLNGGRGGYSSKNCLIGRMAILLEDSELEAGERRYWCRFKLPDQLPSSYDSADYRVKYSIAVFCYLPWWWNAKAIFVLPVTSRPRNFDTTRQAYMPRVWAVRRVMSRIWNSAWPRAESCLVNPFAVSWLFPVPRYIAIGWCDCLCWKRRCCWSTNPSFDGGVRGCVMRSNCPSTR